MSIRKHHPSFPLKLNLESTKDLEWALGYPIVSMKYFCSKKNSKVKELTLQQYKNGKPKKPRIVYNPSHSISFKISTNILR